MRALLDIDLGELEDEPEALYEAADLANIACGGHAGDAASMARALSLCARHGARPGAHPSYDDRIGFGRRTMALPAAAVAAGVAAQCRSLREVAGFAPGHVKLHGALYHDADRDPALAAAVLGAAAAELGAPLVIGPAGGAMAAVSATLGLSFLREGFADRVLGPDGKLLPRSVPGSLRTDPAEAAAEATRLAPRCEAICVHGDTPGAVEIARAVRAALEALP